MLLRFFRTGPDKAPLDDPRQVDTLYRHKRLSVITSIMLGYGFFYTCRLSLSVGKKPMLEEGILDVRQMGIIGTCLLLTYAFGKFFNGFLADRANIGRFMSTGLLVSAIVNLIFGLTSNFVFFAILWAINGWFQSIGSAPSVVSICQWFSNRERGTFYGLWAAAHNIGEGISFVGTAAIVGWLGWRWGFFAPGVVCLGVAAILFITLADRPETYGLPPVSEYRHDDSAGPPSKDSIGRLQIRVITSPLIWVLGVSSACMYMARYAISSWAILFMQEAKGYSIEEASYAMIAYTAFGLCGAIFSGFFSDFFFNSRRNVPTLLYGLLEIGSMVMWYLVPPGHFWWDCVALGGLGFAIGGLIVFLAGLIAVDVFPVRAAGAVKGVIGLFSYIGAAAQDTISGILIHSQRTVVDGEVTHHFDRAFAFWIGASIASLLLACTLWNVKARE